MFKREKCVMSVCIVSLIAYILCSASITLAQDEADDAKIIERYKQMLNRKPKEGSTFDRLYQFYLEGNGLEAMVADYQAEAAATPDAPNLQLILGHIYKRLGKDADAVKAYQRAVELAPNNYYSHFALGQAYAILLQHENAIGALNRAAKIAEETQTATPEDLTATYKALGSAYFRRDRVDEAISAWTKIAELDPENIFARIELADLFREQELYEQAIAQHEAIIAFKAEDPYRVCLSRREIGNIHEAKGDYAAAINSYDSALTLTAPGNWLRKDLQHRIIGIYAADGNSEGLIEYYRKKLQTTPNEPEILGLLAAAYIENQQLNEGITTYQKAVELAPTDANLRLNLISAFRNAEKFEDAAAAYEYLSEQNPDDFGIYRELGELYLQLEDEDKARATYQRMIDRDPENAGTHLILAEIYASNEWIEDAAAAYQKALSLAPSNLDYIEYFGEFYFRQGNREKALEIWNQMITEEKRIAENYERLAKLLETKNFRTEAIAASRKATELMPDVYRYREALAKRLMKNKDYDAALTEYTEAAKVAPNAFFAEEMDNQRIELYRRQGTLVEKIEAVEAELETSGLPATDSFAKQKRLAKMYLKLGNITYALEVLLKAKAHQPDDIIVNRWLAEVYTKQNRRDDANAVYRHLITIDSANTREYYTNIARAHLNGMDYDAATAAAKQVIAHSPRNPEGHQMLAEIAKQAGNYERAIDSLKQALRLRPEAIDIRSELAATYKLSGKPRQALAQYWRCWELSDTVNDKLAFVKPLSEAYYDLGRRGEFEEKLKQLAKSNTSGVGPVIALAELYRMEGDLPSARFQLARALDRERENPDLLTQLVNISVELGDNQDALTYQQRLVKVQPDPSHQRRLGELLFDAGREQEAIQAWTKLLHAKNQTLDAEIKLATLLIRHGLPDEALFVLDRAAEKITGTPNAHLTLYQLGVVLVSMSEFDHARTHFQQILDMPKPPENVTQNLNASNRNASSGPPGINTNKFDLARSLLYRIQDQSYHSGNVQGWIPNNFDEAQAGALVHLVTIAQQHGKLNAFIQQYETALEENPKLTKNASTDNFAKAPVLGQIKPLEILAQIYTLTQQPEKTADMLERLIAVSPNDTVYQAIRFNNAIQRNLASETLEKYLSNITGLTEEARLWYTLQYIQKRYRDGDKTEVEKLMREFENTKVMELNAVEALLETLVLMEKTDAAARIIAHLPIPTQSQQSQYQDLYEIVIDAYTRQEHIDKAIDLFWTYCERTQPQITNTRRGVSHPLRFAASSSPSIQTIFPTSTTYYNGSRLSYLRYFSRRLWLKNQQEALYAKLQATVDTAKGRDRIFAGLALSYCYWWNGDREKARETLVSLQAQFPQDLALKLSTVFLSIQTGHYAGTLKLLDELSVSDPRNRRQYYDLTLQLALQSGNTVAVRDLIVKLLNSPSSAHELYTFSQQLQRAGYTQHATTIMNKAMHLAMGVRDPNFLMELSRHLEDLGRGQDSVQIAERALRFTNHRDRYGRTISSRNLQQATHLTSHSKSRTDQEPQLIDAVQKNPTSYRAFMNLAAFYEGKNKFDKASTAYQNLLTIRPTDSATRKRFAEMLSANGKYEAAVPQYTKLLKDNPTILGYATYDVIETFFKAKKVDELITLSKEIITPSIGRDFNNELARDVVRELMDRNNPKAAIAIYEKLIEAQPSRTGYYRGLASAYAAAGEPEKAIQILRNTLQTEESYPQETIEMLTRFYKLYGGLDAFIKESEAKLAEKPTDNHLRYLLAAMKIAANDLEGADRLVFQLLNEDTFNTRLNTRQLHNLADAYRLAGVREREFQILQRIVQVQNQQGYTDWVPYHRLGMIYALKGEIEKAQDAYRKMGRLRLLYRRNDFVELMNISATYLHNQMWDEAEPLLTELASDLSVSSYYRRQAEEQLVAIKKRRDNISSTTQLKDKIKTMDIETLRTLAKNFVQRGDTQQAVLIYMHLEKVIPEDFESRAQLATLYTTQNQHDNAVATWEALLAEDPGNTKFQDGLVRTYQSAGKIDKALERSQQYIKTDANNSVNYVRLAKLYADDDRIDEAIAAYQKSIELAPGNVKHHLELAALYIRKDDKVSAETAFQAAKRYTAQEWERHDIEQEIRKLSEDQESSDGVMQKAEAEETLTFEMQKEHAETFRDDDKHEEASIAYEKALEMTTNSYERRRIYENLLDIYPKLDKHDAAIEMHDELAFIPYMTNAAELARNRLMNAYKRENKLDALKSIYNTKLENDPNNIHYLEMLAEIYKSTNAHGKAAEAYQAISKLQPDNAFSYYNAAAAYNRDGQSELAEEMLNRGESVLSVSSQRRSSSLLEKLGEICYEGKMYDLAIKFTDSAIAESTGTRVYSIASPVETEYKLLAKSLLAAKRYEEAVHAYQQVANMASSSWDRDEARKAIERALKLGNLYEKQIPKLLEKVQENPDDPEARLTLAQTYEKTDKIEEAIGQYEKLSQRQPDNWQWHKKLGDLYQKQSQHHQTGEVVEGTALTLNGNASFVEIVDSDLLNALTQQTTVSLWMKPTNYLKKYTAILCKADERTPNISNRSFSLFLRDDGVIQFSVSPSGQGERRLYSDPGSILLNRWYHIACVIDASRNDMKLFINGHEVGNRDLGADSVYQSHLPLRIGWTSEEDVTTHGSFAGHIDEVRIWNVARTVTNVRSDMNTPLTGNEAGLVAYWKFDEHTQGIVYDASENKNDGRFIGNAKLASYTRPIFESFNPEQLAQAAAAYESALQFEPNAYELYRSLAETYTKDGRSSDAEAVYRRALDAHLTQNQHDDAIEAIWAFYVNTAHQNRGIAILEELSQKMENSTALHEWLGDVYQKIGDIEKAENAYTQWIAIRQRQLNQRGSAASYQDFAEKLLQKAIPPETAIKFAKRAVQIRNNSEDILTLGYAYLVNGQYDMAVEQFKKGLLTLTSGTFQRKFFSWISEYGKKTQDKEGYVDMLNELVNAISDNVAIQLNLSLALAEFCFNNNMPEKATAYIQKTGFIAENAWWTLGPFDNTDGNGYDTTYIPEDTTQIDTATRYNGIDGQLRWKPKSDDSTLDGYVGLGRDVDWGVAYAFATLVSPDERKVQLRFDSDDQGKVWLNGEEVHAHTKTYRAEIDRYIIPVTLKPGKNSILVKVCEEEGGWGFYLRITDTDGKPFDDLIINEPEEN